MKIDVYHTTEGHIAVTASITMIEMMATDRLDKLTNYVLIEIGNRLVTEYLALHKEELLDKITPILIDKLIEDVSKSLKEALQIKDPEKERQE